MATPAQRGARARAHQRAPSVDLVRLIELLTKAIPPDTSASGYPAAWPLFDFDVERRRLRVNTRGVLSRLYGADAFRSDFKHGEDCGFLRDIELPERGNDARLGGRIAAERLADLPRATAALMKVLDNELSETLTRSEVEASTLVHADGRAYLEELAAAVKARFETGSTFSRLMPIAFAEPSRDASARSDVIARLVAAVEEVETKNWLDNLEVAARRKLRQRGLDDEDIEGAVASLRHEPERLASQTARFLHFLDDEALARVRLMVTFSIMGALKDAAAKRSDADARLLAAYVDNVQQLHATFCDTEELLVLDMSRTYGANGKVSISEQLRKAMYFNCLPVWAEWVNQMFEFRPLSGGSLAREVSYRFRVNGNNPMEGKSAFLARLERIEEELMRGPETASSATSRWLAELYLLAIAVPRLDELAEPAKASSRARELALRLQTGGQHTVGELIAELKTLDTTLTRIARGLVATLRSRGKALLDAAQKSVQVQYVCVQEDVVDWERLSAATQDSKDLFVRPADQAQSEAALWFRSLVITDNPTKVPSLLFSVKVRTLLRERALCVTAPGRDVRLTRDYTGPLLPVSWRPHSIEGDAREWKPRGGDELWRNGPGVDIEYDEASIRRRTKRGGEALETAQQQHAAGAVAFMLLAYLVTRRVRERASAPEGPQLRTLVLRFQLDQTAIPSEQEDGIPGDEVAYAAGQAVEAALACEAPAYMQGLVTGAGRGDPMFRQRGALAALASAFPLTVSMEEPATVKRVALVSYATRPVSEHPAHPTEGAFLYKVRTYVADAVEGAQPGYRLAEERTQLHIQPKEAFEEPALVFEEIGRLKEAGCDHIMLLWHHYGNWRIGRTADRHAPHSSAEFLKNVAKRFPDVTLYTLRRDVFPATRMRERLAQEAAFEVVRVREHEEFWHPVEAEVRRDLVPVYTFATLGVVGDGGSRPQSGFCTYFLELDSRPAQLEWAERPRVNLIDPNQDSTVRPSLIALLRGLHYLQAERAVVRGQSMPVLDPYRWIAPATVGGAGELKVMWSRRRGSVTLSLTALLAHVSTVLRGAAK